VLAAKEKTLSDGDALPQAETRVWGLPLENANGTEVLRPASSTLRWGWSALYVGTVSGELDQRYYNPTAGAFFSPDPGGIKTANPKDPSSWNRYAYVQGDPVNFTDRTGLNRDAAECPIDPTIFMSGWLQPWRRRFPYGIRPDPI